MEKKKSRNVVWNGMDMDKEVLKQPLYSVLKDYMLKTYEAR